MGKGSLMKIEIKNLKINKRMSEETNCFSATLYLDGVKRGEVYNHGHGGCNIYSDRKAQDELEAYAKSLPEREAFGTMLPVSADWLVDDCVEDELMLKDLKSTLKNRVLVVKDGTIRETRKMTTTEVALVADRYRKDGLVVLNSMSIDKAFETYKANVTRG